MKELLRFLQNVTRSGHLTRVSCGQSLILEFLIWRSAKLLPSSIFPLATYVISIDTCQYFDTRRSTSARVLIADTLLRCLMKWLPRYCSRCLSSRSSTLPTVRTWHCTTCLQPSLIVQPYTSWILATLLAAQFTTASTDSRASLNYVPAQLWTTIRCRHCAP